MKRLFAFLFLLLPASLLAQTVNYTAPGIISITGVPVIYNDKYVIQKTDFGFMTLDTVSLTAGLVQVEAKCGVGQPSSATNVYVIGDCNGITNVSSSGSSVLARQFSGQCGAATTGCGGPRVDGTGFFLFSLGTWAYEGKTTTDIADSTQTADLSGRHWTVTATDTTGLHFVWTASAGTPGAPTTTPTRTPTRTITPTPVLATATPTRTATTGPSPTPTLTPNTHTVVLNFSGYAVGQSIQITYNTLPRIDCLAESAPCTYTLGTGGTVELTASDSGTWSGTGAASGCSTDPCTFTLSENSTATAVYPPENTPGPGTPTWTPTPTVTGTPTPTPTATGTATATPTITPTPWPTGAPVYCSGDLTVSVGGAVALTRFTDQEYTALVRGGTPPYRYFWSCDFNMQAPVFIPTGTDNVAVCCFPTARNWIVEAKVYDANNVRGYCGMTVLVTK